MACGATRQRLSSVYVSVPTLPYRRKRSLVVKTEAEDVLPVQVPFAPRAIKFESEAEPLTSLRLMPSSRDDLVPHSAVKARTPIKRESVALQWSDDESDWCPVVPYRKKPTRAIAQHVEEERNEDHKTPLVPKRIRARSWSSESDSRKRVRRRQDSDSDDDSESVLNPKSVRRKTAVKTLTSDSDSPALRKRLHRKPDSDSDEPESIPNSSRRKKAVKTWISDSDSPAPRKRLRRKPESDSDEPDPECTPRPIRKRRRGEALTSDSDSPAPRKRLHREPESNSDEPDSQSIPNSTRRRTRGEALTLDSDFPAPRRRLRRKPESDAEEVDSEDMNDLELPTPPARSKPTPKEIKTQAMELLKDCRNNKASPIAVRKLVSEDVDNSSSSGIEQDDDTQSDTASESASTDGNFIDDDNVASDEEREALGLEWYARRPLDQQFTAFIEYLVELHFNSGLHKLTEKDNMSYQAALDALRTHVGSRADSMLRSTWTASFKTTLDQRPVLVGPVQSETSDCQACWTRGTFKCNTSGSHTLSTRKGFYDRHTFEDIPERFQEYGGQTTQDFENSAQAEQLLYPPGFRLIVGNGCVHRAVAYHQARHYLYNIAVRVRDEIERVCDSESEALKDRRGLTNRITGSFRDELWENFRLDSQQWKTFIPGGL